MKVLIHTYDYVPTTIATSYRMKAMADAFVENGDETYVLTRNLNSNYQVHLKKEKVITSYAYDIKKKNNLTRFFSYFTFGISSYFKAKKIGDIDVVITSTPPQIFNIWGYKIAKKKKAKLVYDVRDIWPDVGVEMGNIKENSILYKVFTFMSNYMYKHSDLILTVSKGKIKKIKERTDKEVWLVENGFDENVINYEEDKKIINKYELDKKESCVYIGNIGLAQSLENLLYCAEKTKHKEIQFLLFGKGAAVDRLQQIINEKELSNVKICGIIDHNKIKTILSNSKLCFVPLKNSKLTDSIPTKTYEALGLGCPVLLAACGDSRELIEETSFGYYTSPDNKEDILKNFDLLLDNYNEIIKNKDKAKKIVISKYSRQKNSYAFVRRLFNK